jgi:hypothetical protein
LDGSLDSLLAAGIDVGLKRNLGLWMGSSASLMVDLPLLSQPNSDTNTIVFDSKGYRDTMTAIKDT